MKQVGVAAFAAMVVLTVATAGAGAVPVHPAAAARAVPKPLWQQSRDYWTTLRAPREAPASGRERVGGPRRVREDALERRHALGFPPAAQELERREEIANETGRSPRRTARLAGMDAVQRAQLLVLLVQFDPNANDDFSGFERYDAEAEGNCVTEPAGTTFSGPVHNQMPDPADAALSDNNTFWVPDFNREHYEKLIFSSEGLTEPIRPDLKGGVDISGRTVKNYYAEVSKGRYDLEGGVTPWLTVPHSEAWYSADSCAAGEKSDAGAPENPRGKGQMAIDAMNELAATQPDFPWADYDVEDQGDLDGDGNLYEPNGVIDHVVLVHAGSDQADGGGAQGTYADWASAQAIDPAAGGHEIGDTGFKFFNYIVQAEDAGAGVIAHEFGHDLGLPDLYDNISGTEPDVGWWDLMSTGSHSGPLFQTIPTHMGAWSKYVLGWDTPKVLEYGSKAAQVTLGQASRPPAGTEDSVRIDLPDKRVTVGAPHSGANAWWSNYDQDYADVRLTRSLDVPQGADVRFWSWDDYVIEELWDYGFIEVSTDDGATWTQLEVRDEAGNLVSTDEDPNRNLASFFGGVENGLTGSSGGYRHDWVDLTPYAGRTVQLRLRYLTDAAFQERGWFADDFEVTADGQRVWSDDVEGGDNGWTAQRRSLGNTRGAGWVRTSGSFDAEQYYLAEWRTATGFDAGLRTPYATNYDQEGAWNVTRTPYNAPGLLLWYRDGRYNSNDIGSHLADPPSIGSKGTALLVDAHYEPTRLRGEAAAANPSLMDNLNGRQQAMDAAFGPVGRYGFRLCYQPGASATDLLCNQFGRRAGVLRFTDARTWYPGIEYRPDLDPEEPLFYRDADASVVVPSKANEIYSTRVVDRNGRLLPQLFGTPFGEGHVLGTGNPADGRPANAETGDPGTAGDLSLGVRVAIRHVRADKTTVRVRVRPGHRAGR
jgi:immune inhibitor A